MAMRNAGITLFRKSAIAGIFRAVCVAPRETASALADVAEAGAAKEAATRQRLQSSELGLDIYGKCDELKKGGPAI